MRNKLINLISLVPVIFGEYTLVKNYLYFKPLLTTSVDRVLENSVVSGNVFTFIQYGYIIGIGLLAVLLVLLAFFSWKEKSKLLLVSTSIISTLTIFIVGSLLAISNSVFSFN